MIMLKLDNVSKEYKLGQIGRTTLRAELQRKRAKRRGEEDPTKKIGAKTYAANETFMALDGISFEVKKGERVGIIGHNGAGKSTLLKLISRVTAPSGGMIGLNGRVASMLEVGTGFHGELTGRENIYMNGAILGMTKAEIDSKIEDIIEFSEVRQFIDTPVKRYSSGMYVKLAFSVAAHLDSEIMIMDEVLAVGDMAFQKKCLDKMNDVSRSEGKTVLYVSHNMNTIRQLCDRVIVLDHGKIVFDGGVDEGIEQYLGRKNTDLPIHYDLDPLVRRSSFRGTKIHFQSFDFIRDRKASFSNNEPLSFKLTFKANENLDGLRLYSIIQTAKNEAVGLTQSTKDFGSAKKGCIYSAVFQLDISNLSAGTYILNPDIFSLDEYGNHLSYDNTLSDIPFEITDGHAEGLKWRGQFGKVRLNPLECLEIQRIEESV